MTIMKGDKPPSRFLLCVRNEGCDDLEPRKIYHVLPDRRAARDGFVRVIDESGEDYLYPAEYFVRLRLPLAVARQLAPQSTAAPAQRSARVRASAIQ